MYKYFTHFVDFSIYILTYFILSHCPSWALFGAAFSNVHFCCATDVVFFAKLRKYYDFLKTNWLLCQNSAVKVNFENITLKNYERMTVKSYQWENLRELSIFFSKNKKFACF